MSSVLSPGSSAPGGLFGALRAWLRAWSVGPLPPPEKSAPEAAWPGALRGSAPRVLVVDDSDLNLTVISGLMESMGLVPLLAMDGSEAVALACERPFDLILMDMQMPVLDGFEATQAIRHFEATSGRAPVPIVAYTSMTLNPRVMDAYGINGVLAKPCDANDLEGCLLRWCPGYRAHQALQEVPSVTGRGRAPPSAAGSAGAASR